MAVQQVPGLEGSTYVYQGSSGGLDFFVGGRVHAGVLVEVVVTRTPPPGSGGRSLLLIRVADHPSRISRSFPPLVVLLSGVVKSSRSDHLSSTSDHLSGIYLPRGHNCHRRSTKTQPSPCARGCSACVSVSGSRRCNRASGACAGMTGSRHVSIVSRSVGTER